MSYTEDERGIIKHPDRLKQIISFEGIKRLNRNITPTDIDCVVDYNGNAFIFCDAKCEDVEFHEGQKRAIENIINGLHENRKPSCFLLARHNVPINEKVILKDCLVEMIYYEHNWKYYNKNNVISCIKMFEDRWIKIGVIL